MTQNNIMKQTYKKPFSTVIQITTESIIATSEIMAIMSTENLNMEVHETDYFGSWQ